MNLAKDEGIHRISIIFESRNGFCLYNMFGKLGWVRSYSDKHMQRYTEYRFCIPTIIFNIRVYLYDKRT